MTLTVPKTTSPESLSIRYSITDLGTLGFESTAMGINNNSQVTGQSFKEGVRGIYLWQDGRMRDVGTLPGKTESVAIGINAVGDMVGSASNGGDTGSDPPVAILVRRGEFLRLFPGIRHSEAMAINDKGQIVGETCDKSSIRSAFLWQDGKTTTLGSLNGGDTYANDINARGQVVGDSSVNGHSLHAFLWENGTMTDIGTLGGDSVDAAGINDMCQVVGTSSTGSGQHNAFLWEKGTIYDLGSPGDGLCSARRINNKGVIVGDWWPQGASYEGSRALVWINRKMYDINDLINKGSGWVLEYGSDVNDKGEIVGSGKHNGQNRAFLLRPEGRKGDTNSANAKTAK